tara:strand:- start:1064 stop:1300 length:237 start_codon:yes stop_codon:yes gene_type:complete
MNPSDIPTESQLAVMTAYNKLFDAVLAVDFIDLDEKYLLNAIIEKYQDEDYGPIMHRIMDWAINDSDEANHQREQEAQ